MAKKITNHTHKTKKPTNNSTSDWSEYLNTVSNQMVPCNASSKERFFIELLTWARENPKAYKLTQFYTMKGIDKKTVTSWLNDDEKYARFFEDAMTCLADRREVGAVERHLSEAMVKFTMPLYDKDWQTLVEMYSALKEQQASASASNFKIELPPIENSPLVPEKKSK